MWWPENTIEFKRLAASVGALAMALMVAGCFQPLYGDRSPLAGPGKAGALSAVQVDEIDAPNGTPVARLGVEVRNALIFDLTGGGAPSAPTHQLKIALVPVRTQVIVDITTGRPDVENYGIDATYSLTEIATKKVVVKGRTFSRVSYDIPGQQQRFARARGLRDAENRAAKVIADEIQARLASYFLAGT
jgi:LPS-assembly lipoprotein